ncbi:hypothetical protein QBC46DRAFT_402156 [Diplogelasinospora grovesii]|uniref:Uncharacterized protein n=1 Tax=Diplogelasinospora grovesii TaxID=303347 RepID=A0AAN6RYI1_9PEZI|nr:hypothetical protein QBC46DRAFT_402156 [Diplogelasinospora grovesii]
MATSQSGQWEEPPYLSFKELRGEDAVVRFSPAARRLFWPLDGVFPTAISVMKTPRSADNLEPFFQPDTGGSGSGTWHEISQLPLTEPKVSSVEASVFDFGDWEYNWLVYHEGHDGAEFGPEYVTYGDLSDEEEDSDKEFLVRCCGDDRPLRKRGIKLVVTPSAGSNSFVTVQDYVSAVHPWLMSLREDILKAKMLSIYEPYSVVASTEWMVDEGPEHMIMEKKRWIQEHGGGPPQVLSASALAIIDRIRASRNR